VHRVMVRGAQERQVIDIGPAAVSPLGRVMGIASFWWCGAVGDHYTMLAMCGVRAGPPLACPRCPVSVEPVVVLERRSFHDHASLAGCSTCARVSQCCGDQSVLWGSASAVGIRPLVDIRPVVAI
jgi:hypothetical protein